MGLSGLSRNNKHEWCKVDLFSQRAYGELAKMSTLHHECLLFRDKPRNPHGLSYLLHENLNFTSQEKKQDVAFLT